MTEPKDVDAWSEAATDWIAWARSEGHDAYWAYRTALLEFIGAGTGAAIDIGCGEGRLSRDLTALGYTVTACDGVAAMVAAARDAGSAQSYHTAPAHALPVPSGSQSLALLYNVLMDTDDIATALLEAHRVLPSGGRLIIGIVHPTADVLGQELHGRTSTPYAETARFDETVTEGGLTMRFRGWKRPLSAYINAIIAAGFTLTALREPMPSNTTGWHGYEKWKSLPLFLWIDARKP